MASCNGRRAAALTAGVHAWVLTAAGPESRLAQIAEWLGDESHLIVLDECHRWVGPSATLLLDPHPSRSSMLL